MSTSGEQNSFSLYPEWLKRFEFVENQIIRLINELFEEEQQMNKTDDFLEGSQAKEVDFYHLDPDQTDPREIEEMQRLIQRLARRINTRLALRHKRAKRGDIDLRRTMQQAMATTGGVPLNLRHKTRIVSRPEIILLCDVSESVSAFSTFMLQMVYTIQNRLNFVRSFLFVDIVDEVTAYFQSRDVEQGIGDALSRGNYCRGVTSDYGKVFDIFARTYLKDISPKATLIILGDACNNLYPEQGRSFERVREHLRRIIWLNPQPAEEWNTRDSIMDLFSPNCDQVFECRNIRQLEQMVDMVF